MNIALTRLAPLWVASEFCGNDKSYKCGWNDEMCFPDANVLLISFENLAIISPTSFQRPLSDSVLAVAFDCCPCTSGFSGSSHCAAVYESTEMPLSNPSSSPIKSPTKMAFHFCLGRVKLRNADLPQVRTQNFIHQRCNSHVINSEK